MKVQVRTAKGAQAVSAAIVEILGSRVTVKHENGDFADVQLKDVVSFEGRVSFDIGLGKEEKTRNVYDFEMHSNSGPAIEEESRNVLGDPSDKPAPALATNDDAGSTDADDEDEDATAAAEDAQAAGAQPRTRKGSSKAGN